MMNSPVVDSVRSVVGDSLTSPIYYDGVFNEVGFTNVVPVLSAVLGMSIKVHGIFVYGFMVYSNVMIAAKDFSLNESALMVVLCASPLIFMYYMDSLNAMTNALGCFALVHNILTKDWWPTFLIVASVALHHALFY